MAPPGPSGGTTRPEAVRVLRPTLDDVEASVVPLHVPEVGSTSRPTSTFGSPEWVRQVMTGAPRQRSPFFELAPGLMIPGTRYRVMRWIADGGMGVVYEALDEELHREIALKVLRAEYCSRPNLVDQFREEARAVARIGSEHIVRLHDFGSLPDGRHFFTMELLSGERLSDLLGTISFDRFFAIGRQVCKALAMAHDAGIVHRDIKPDNVMMITRDDRSDFVKVLDFGLATMHGAVDTWMANAGTPWYMAPEAIGQGEGDHRLDVYALGCTFYELLTGRPPFDDAEPKEVLMAHLEQYAARPSEVSARPIPAPIEDVVMRCLEKDPDARPIDMRALEAMLVEAQIACRVRTTWDDLPLPRMDGARREQLDAGLRAIGSPRLDRKQARRRRLAWILSASVVAVSGVAAAVWWPRAEEAVADSDPRVESMTIAARAAAAKANFVYPPADAPDEPTAFSRVLELERLETEGVAGADARAGLLRTEFAKTLVRLGDEYWDAEGGQPFAIDYYAQAELFAPLPGHAAERVTLTPGELAVLRRKASSGDFTNAELVAAEPLAALALSDPQARREATQRMASRVDRRSAITGQRLEKLLSARGEAPASATEAAAAKPEPAAEAPTVAAAADDQPTIEPTIEPAAAAAPADPDDPTAKPARDPKRAAALCSDGESALRGGQLDAAHAAFERALAYDRRSPRALIGMADVYFERGNYGKSASWAAKAVAAAPTVGAYRLRLGDAYFKVQRWQDARDAYARAQELGEAGARSRLDKVEPKLAP